MQVQSATATLSCSKFVLIKHNNEYDAREFQLGADVLLASTASPLETLIDQSVKILLVGKKSD
jgi:hypothetical protein